MTTLTIRIPDGKTPDVSSYIKEIGGEVVFKKAKSKDEEEYDEDNEVPHNVFLVKISGGQ